MRISVGFRDGADRERTDRLKLERIWPMDREGAERITRRRELATPGAGPPAYGANTIVELVKLTLNRCVYVTGAAFDS